jgi:3-polyprenyl-4-hydroxybenzoate decarboxylase
VIPAGWSGLHVRFDNDVDIHNKLQVWFHMLASMDPQRDVSVAEGMMTIDARTIGKPETRDWPPFLGWTSAS